MEPVKMIPTLVSAARENIREISTPVSQAQVVEVFIAIVSVHHCF